MKNRNLSSTSIAMLFVAIGVFVFLVSWHVAASTGIIHSPTPWQWWNQTASDDAGVPR